MSRQSFLSHFFFIFLWRVLTHFGWKVFTLEANQSNTQKIEDHVIRSNISKRPNAPWGDIVLSTAVSSTYNHISFLRASRIQDYTVGYDVALFDIWRKYKSFCFVPPILNSARVSVFKFLMDPLYFSFFCCQVLIEHGSRVEWNRLETYSRILILLI